MSPGLSKHETVLEQLMCGPITPLDMQQRFGITRLAAVVHDLRADGFKITTEVIGVQNRWGQLCHVARYTLRDRRRAKSLRLQRLRKAKAKAQRGRVA